MPISTQSTADKKKFAKLSERTSGLIRFVTFLPLSSREFAYAFHESRAGSGHTPQKAISGSRSIKAPLKFSLHVFQIHDDNVYHRRTPYALLRFIYSAEGIRKL